MNFTNMLLDTSKGVADKVAETVTNASTNFETLTGNEPFGERLLYGLKVAAIGILVVFMVLLILWAIVTAMGKIMGISRKNPEKTSLPDANNAGSGAESLENASEEETVVAVASAAIAAYEGKSNVDFEIKSVTPITFTEENK